MPFSRSIDARLTLAALSVAIEGRKPPPGCVHHFDRGSQYAAKVYRDYLADHGIEGSMGRRGNPYDNAKAESFMKTLKVEGVYLADEHQRSSTAPFGEGVDLTEATIKGHAVVALSPPFPQLNPLLPWQGNHSVWTAGLPSAGLAGDGPPKLARHQVFIAADVQRSGRRRGSPRMTRPF
jgi:transposase InsO family protein